MFFYVFLLVIGLVVGSFISALSYRLPRKISNINGRSFCDNCKAKINWYDNIPVLSYIILNGRCRICKNKISLRYPLIEITTAIVFTLIGVNILYLVLFCIFELIFIIDLEHQIIPDSLVFIILIILFAVFINNNSIFISLFAGFVSATFLMLIHLVTKGRGMGLGDVKMAIVGGMIVGLNLIFLWFFAAFALGAIVGIILIMMNRVGLKSKIAFGPFLIVGMVFAVVWGDIILNLYFR